MSEAAINDAMKAAREFLQNTAERRAYINREMAIIDYNTDRQDAYEDGMHEGIAKGKVEGEGEGNLAKLLKLLKAAGRLKDMDLAIEDEEARKKLYKEYHIE